MALLEAVRMKGGRDGGGSTGGRGVGNLCRVRACVIRSQEGG